MIPQQIRAHGSNTFLRLRQARASNSQVKQFGLACFLLCCVTLVLKSSVSSHRQTSLRLSQLPLQTTHLEEALLEDPLQDETKVVEPHYPMPDPIHYFEHGPTGLGWIGDIRYGGSSDYCVLNTTRDDCCTPKHCATIVRRSTLYSECCHHLHTTEHPETGELVVGKRSKIFPLLITGTPRTGTWYMQQLLTKTGLQGMTTDEHSPDWMGTVSWKHVFEKERYYFGPKTATHLYGSKFRMIWHMVRDPLEVGNERRWWWWCVYCTLAICSMYAPNHAFTLFHHSKRL